MVINMRGVIIIFMLLILASSVIALEPAKLRLGRIYIDDFIYLNEMQSSVNVENNFNTTLKELRYYFYIPELAVYSSRGIMEIDDDDSETISLIVELPEDTPSGWYVARITVSNDIVRRTKYREIYVE